MPIRVAALWPRPRAQRWRLGIERPDTEPDQSDALLGLEAHGCSVAIEDSCPYPLNPLARMHEMWSGVDPLRSARVLWRLRRYDVVVGVGDAVARLLVPARRIFRFQTRIVLIDPALSTNYPRRQRLQDRVIPYVDRVVVFGKAQREFLRERYKDRIRVEVVPHRIDTDFYCPALHDDSDETSGSPEAGAGRPRVLSVGEDGSRDFSTLAEAVAMCRRRNRPDFDCAIKTSRAGTDYGPDIEVLRAPVSWVELRALYRRAAVVVLPLHDSLHAGGINTLLEAMATARPVVVTASRGIDGYVTHDVDATVVPPHDAAAMAAAITGLLDDPRRAAEMGRAARTRVLERCSNQRYAARLGEVLHEMMEDR